MRYFAHIEYIDNPNKAGKLTLKKETGEVVLSKIPVAIPTNIDSINTSSSLSIREIKSNPTWLSRDDAEEYKKELNDIDHSLSGERFITDKKDNVIIAMSKKNQLVSDKNAFVLDNENFNKLATILNKFDVTLTANKVNFLWMPKSVSVSKNDINKEIGGFLKAEGEIIRNVKKEEDNKKPKVESVFKDVGKKNTNKRTISQPTPSNFNNDGLDPLDILLAYYNPAMAIFLRPTSILAWSMFYANSWNKNSIENGFNKIPGFDGIGSCSFKRTEDGYKVAFYSDENKTDAIGVMEFDERKNEYVMLSNEGDKSTLIADDFNNNYKMSMNFDGSEVDLDFKKTQSGFVGNWTSNNNDIDLGAGIVVNNDFCYSSKPGELYDLQNDNLNNISNSFNTEFDYGNGDFINNNIVEGNPYEGNQVNVSNNEQDYNFNGNSINNDINNGYNYNSNDDYQNNNTNDFSNDYNSNYVPPPPPPPPQNDSWGSDDPYSNSPSFRM